MRTLRAAASTLGAVASALARQLWRTAGRIHAAVRGSRRARAEPAAVRRQYVFGAISRKAFDTAMRRRRKGRKVA